jgi:predicted AlkP superfamily phosphohydrolase/phosphomutase
MSNRTLLIGVDAGDFRTIEPMLEGGELPNLQKLIDDGFRGSLSSSIPPWTPTAWTSLTTGKNPGKHGIFDFKMPGTNELVDSADIQTNTIWDYLTEAGEPSIIVNVPVTHPASEINGVLVPGYLGPEVNEAIAHPDGILDELQEEIGEYRIYKSDDVTGGQELCEEYLRLMQMRADAMTYLCTAYDWSFAMVQFQRTDTVFHELPEEKYIRSVYRKLDDCVGQILTNVDTDNLLVASDHGIGETGNWDFRVNTWLLKNGYLETDTQGYSPGWKKPDETISPGSDTDKSGKSPFARAVNAAGTVGITPRRIEHGFKRLGIAELVMRLLPDAWLQTAIAEGSEQIDIDASTAYCPSGPGLGILCNDAKKDRLIKELSSIYDPDGQRVFEWVRSAEEVYSGLAVNTAPDIIAYPREMAYYISATLAADEFAKSRYAYNHMQDGIFLGQGADVNSVDKHINGDITDVAPSVLSFLQVELDQDFNGSPVEAILDGLEIPEKRVYDTVNRTSSETDRDDVETRLKDLGYMN